MATRAALLVVLLAGCNAPVGFSYLSEQHLVFAGQRSGERVSGVLFFGTDSAFHGAVPGKACFSLEPAIEVTLNGGAPLARGTGPCLKNGVKDRWTVPEVQSVQSEDLNVVVTDGTSVARAVIPGALVAPTSRLTELAFTGEERQFLNLGFSASQVKVHYVGLDGSDWTAEADYQNITPVPGAGSGTATISGTALIEGSTCRGFAGCRAEVPFTLSVPAHY